MKKLYSISTYVLSVLMLSLAVIPARSQSNCVVEDNFNRANNNTVGNSWLETETAVTGIKISSNYVMMTNSAVSGTEFLYKDFNGVYPTTFSTSPMDLAWAFNMGCTNLNPNGFGAGQHGLAFILGCTTTNPATGNGYAIVLGSATAPRKVRLVKFTGGIVNSTDIIATAGGYGVSGLSIRVVYTPSSNSWVLFLESNGTPTVYPQADPRNTVNWIGVASDNTYTGSNLRYMGAFFNHPAAVDWCLFDDICRPQLPAITTGAVTGGPFNLVDCLTTGAGTVAFTSTGSFTAGNVYTAQLSDASGSFAAPVNIGTLASTANSGTINITIPAGTPTGTLYKIRINSTNPVIAGSVSANISITQAGCVSASSDYFRSRVTGNWTTAATWESSHNNITWFTATIPPSEFGVAQSIQVRSGHTLTLGVSRTFNKLTVESGATVNLTANMQISDAAGVPEDLVVYGTVTTTVNGVVTINAPAVGVFKTGSVYNHQRDAGNMPWATWDAGSTVNVTGITSTGPGRMNNMFGIFNWNCPSQATIANSFLNPVGTSAFGTTGALTISSTGTGAFCLSLNNATESNHNFGSIRTMNNAQFRFSQSISGNPAGVVTVDVAGNLSVEGTSKIDFGNGSGTPSFGYYRGRLILRGNLSISSTGTFTCTDIWYGEVRFNKNGTQTADLGTGSTVNRLDYRIIPNSTTIMLSNFIVYDYAVNDYTELEVQDGAVLDAGTSMRILGAGHFTLLGWLRSANINGIAPAGSLNVTGPVYFDLQSTVEYYLAGNQVFDGRSDYGNVVVNGTGMKTLNGNATVRSQLFLQVGKVPLGSYNLSLINNSATGAIPVFTNNSYVVTDGSGSLQRAVSAGGFYEFPVGNAYNIEEADIEFFFAPGANTLSARFVPYAGGSNGLPLSESGDPIERTSVYGYWEVNAATPIATNYNGYFLATGFPDIIDYSRLHLLKRPNAASPWILQGTHVPTTGSNSSAQLNRTGFSGFSQFAVGGQQGVALPVTILNFAGYREGTTNKLTWISSQEMNNTGFEVLRSADGVNFKAIGFVNTLAPGGNSDTPLEYHFTDSNPATLNQYYRLKQVDIDGQSKFSNTIFIKSDLLSAVNINRIYPVPANSSVNMVVESPGREEIKLIVTDMSGREMIQKEVNIVEGYNTITLDISRLTPGNYLLKLVGSKNNDISFGKLLKL